MDSSSYSGLSFNRYSGAEIETIQLELAQLRIAVFYEFPYLYEGTLAYELKYLETYSKAKNAFVFLVRDGEKVIGASTGIPLSEESAAIQHPFIKEKIELASIFYLGESILLKPYRGKGLGRLFFEKREEFARSIQGIQACYFCSVLRQEDHPLKPVGYKNNETFWKNRGYQPITGFECEMSWLDSGEIEETTKKLQFWKKEFRTRI